MLEACVTSSSVPTPPQSPIVLNPRQPHRQSICTHPHCHRLRRRFGTVSWGWEYLEVLYLTKDTVPTQHLRFVTKSLHQQKQERTMHSSSSVTRHRPKSYLHLQPGIVYGHIKLILLSSKSNYNYSRHRKSLQSFFYARAHATKASITSSSQLGSQQVSPTRSIACQSESKCEEKLPFCWYTTYICKEENAWVLRRQTSSQRHASLWLPPF